VGQAFGLAGINNTLGAPSFAYFAALSGAEARESEMPAQRS